MSRIIRYKIDSKWLCTTKSWQFSNNYNVFESFKIELLLIFLFCSFLQSTKLYINLFLLYKFSRLYFSVVLTTKVDFFFLFLIFGPTDIKLTHSMLYSWITTKRDRIIYAGCPPKKFHRMHTQTTDNSYKYTNGKISQTVTNFLISNS